MMRLIDADMLPMALDGHIVSIWKKDLDAVPTIDPVHAAGGCYCKECAFWLRDSAILPDGKPANWGYCDKLLDSDSGEEIMTAEMGFCSYGERKEALYGETD